MRNGKVKLRSFFHFVLPRRAGHWRLSELAHIRGFLLRGADILAAFTPILIERFVLFLRRSYIFIAALIIVFVPKSICVAYLDVNCKCLLIYAERVEVCSPASMSNEDPGFVRHRRDPCMLRSACQQVQIRHASNEHFLKSMLSKCM